MKKEDRKTAVALKYEAQKDKAPKVVAKGKGYLAERIIQLAKEYNIPLHQDKDLVQVLAQLDLGEFIPPELYQVVAEILAWVYSINKKYKL